MSLLLQAGQRRCLAILRNLMVGAYLAFLLGFETSKIPRLGAVANTLNSEIQDVDIISDMDVVQHIPSRVIGIFVDDEVIAAVPAPIGADRPSQAATSK